MDRNDPAFPGQRDYSPLLLNLYDPLVLGPIARFIWRCPASRLVDQYRRHIRPNHLDVGPGTGYFIANSGLPDRSPVTILDPNRHVLAHSVRRLARLDVTAVEADVLKPLPLLGAFDSVALNLVVHCLPGPLSRKAPAMTNVRAVMAPDGVLFGASVLGANAGHSWPARGMLAAFNRQGSFDNLADTEDGLRALLASAFEAVEFERVGSIAIFAAKRPRVS